MAEGSQIVVVVEVRISASVPPGRMAGAVMAEIAAGRYTLEERPAAPMSSRSRSHR